MKIAILIDLCMLIKSLYGPKFVGPTDRPTEVTENNENDKCVPLVTSVGRSVGPTTLGPLRLLISMQRSISMAIFIKIAVDSVFPYTLAMCDARKNTRYRSI